MSTVTFFYRAYRFMAAAYIGAHVPIAALICFLAVGLWLTARNTKARERFYATQGDAINDIGAKFVDAACKISLNDGSVFVMRDYYGLEHQSMVTNTCAFRTFASGGSIMNPAFSQCGDAIKSQDPGGVVESIGEEGGRCVVHFRNDRRQKAYADFADALRDLAYSNTPLYADLLHAFDTAVAEMQRLEAEIVNETRLLREAESQIKINTAKMGEANRALAAAQANLSSVSRMKATRDGTLAAVTRAFNDAVANRVKAENAFNSMKNVRDAAVQKRDSLKKSVDDLTAQWTAQKNNVASITTASYRAAYDQCKLDQQALNKKAAVPPVVQPPSLGCDKYKR